MGFYDQHDRLIVTTTNLVWANNNGHVVITGLASGTYHVTELATQAGQTGLLSTTLVVAGGKGTLSVALGRYDTRVFAIE